MSQRRLVGVPDAVPAPGAFGTLERPRLIERLDNALALRVACIVAPAGYGKSTLVHQYLERAVRPTAFVRVPTGGGLLAFAAEAAQAIGAIDADAPRDFGNASESAQRAPRPELVLADWLAHLLAEHPSLLVVIDDTEQLRDEASAALLRELIKRAKRTQFVVLSRASPPLPLTKWLAYGQVDFPIDLAELRFREDEFRAYVERTGLALPEQTLVRVMRLADGWPMVAALAMRAAARAGGDLRQIEGATREVVFDFFAEDITASLPANVRRFIVDTSPFDTLEIPLLERYQRYDGARGVLEQLYRDGAFVFRDSDDVFHYHGLFRDFARRELHRLPAEERRAAYVAAAETLLSGQRYAEALPLLCEAGERLRVQALLRECYREVYVAGRADVLLRALELLDDPNDPEVLALRALVAARTGRTERTNEVPALVERVEASAPDGIVRLEARLALATYLSSEMRYAEALEIVRAETSAALLPREIAFDLYVLAVGSLTALGESEEAQRCLQQMSLLAAPAQRHRVAYANVLLAFNRSELSLVERFAEEMLAEAEGAHDIMSAARARVALARVAQLRGEVAAAVRYARESAEAFRRAGDAHSESFALSWLVTAAGEAGEFELVSEAAERFEVLTAMGIGGRVQSLCIPAAQAIERAARGDFQGAFGVIASSSDLPSWDQTTLRLAEIAFYAAAAAQREHAEARLTECLQRLREHSTESADAFRRMVLALIYLAHANLVLGRFERGRSLLDELGRAKGALERKARLLYDLARATYLAAGGHEAGEERRRSAIERLERAGFGGLAKVFANLGVPVSAEDEEAPVRGLGTLTKTELSLLNLVAEGMASKEIGLRLGRSAQTVDKHLTNAMRKLGCRSRTEAVALARRHGFLD